MSERTDKTGAKSTGGAAGPTPVPDRQVWTGANGRGRRRTVTYADAGVSIHAGERAVELLKNKVHRTHRPEVLGDLGGFAGLFRLDITKYRSPVLASSTDGVGTKLVIAQAMGIHDTVGIDLVAMSVNDCLCTGGEPLVFLDYIAMPKDDPALTKAVARAHKWFGDLASGRARSLAELAKAEGLSDRYVSRLVLLAFLAPKIVEAILAGTQPVELTAEILTKRADLPLSWVEQKTVLGFN